MIRWLMSFFKAAPEDDPGEMAHVEHCDGEVSYTQVKRFKDGTVIALIYSKWRVVGMSFVTRVIEDSVSK